MPTYEYKCDNCQNEFEVEQSITSEKNAVCPKCSNQTTNRLISRSSFSLKGDCWAKDSYSKKKV